MVAAISSTATSCRSTRRSCSVVRFGGKISNTFPAPADMLADEMVTDAVLSPCGEFRYLRKRQWGPLTVGKKPALLGFLMLNPSTADAAKDDPTIRRCIGFGKQLDYDGIIVANLFAYRSPHPEMLKTAEDP